MASRAPQTGRSPDMNRDCQPIRDLLDSYLSNELTVESVHAVHRHLDTCGGCAGELVRRERTRALLRQAVDVPVDVTTSMARIAGAIDREQRLRSRLARYGAAIVLLAVVGIGLWLWDAVDVAAFNDSVDNHVVCALKVPPTAAYDDDRAARRLDPQSLGVVSAMARRYGNYDLVDAHMCRYLGRDYVHMVYRAHGRPISLFAEPILHGALPAQPSVTRKGYVSVGVATAHHHVFIVHDQAAPPSSDVVTSMLDSAVSSVRNIER